MKKDKRVVIGQGDVALGKIGKLPADVQLVSGEFKLQGERQGHTHCLPDVEVYTRKPEIAPQKRPRVEIAIQERPRLETFIVVADPEGRTMTHEEHKPLMVPPGTYQVLSPREFVKPEKREVLPNRSVD